MSSWERDPTTGNLTPIGGYIPFTHVGQIIESTTLDTEAKMQQVYGSHTRWIQHSGYILRGATSGVTDNDNTNSGSGFGGSDTVTLTGAQSGLKGHGHGFTQPTVNGGATNTGYVSSDHGHSTTLYKAGNAGNGNGTVFSTYMNLAGSGSYGTGGISANHYHSQVAHTHSVSGGAVSDAAASNATAAHSIVQRYKNVYIWERTA